MRANDLKILQDFLSRTQNTVYPAELSLKLYRLKKEVEIHVKEYTELLNKIVDKCLVKKEDGNIKMSKDGTVTIIDGFEQEWNDRTKELEELDFKFKNIVTVSELKSIEITPLEIQALIELENSKDSTD